MSSAERLEVRSFRAVFDLERRVYRIDSLRLNPSGVPLSGIAYGVLCLLVCQLLVALPVVDAIAGLAPWYIGQVAMPLLLAAALTLARVDGRPFHVALGAVVGEELTPRRSYALGAHDPPERWRPGGLTLVPDGSGSRLRRLRFSGPGAVMVNVAHSRAEWPGGRGPFGRPRAQLTIHPAGGAHAHMRVRSVALALNAETVLEVTTTPVGAAR